MSPLAFDKQGKPFTFQRRTKRLLVRLFRNPSARGTCCQVLGGDGQALYVDPETDYVEFRRAVGQVPGLYRLDQCDEDGNELEDAQPAYVSIDVARNAQNAEASSGDVNPLVIIQQMAAIQADVMKTMAEQQAALLAATAEILRAPYRPAAAAAPAAELRNAADGSDEDDDRDEEIEEEPQPESTLISVARMVDSTMPSMAAQLGEFLYEKIFELMNKRKKPAPASAMPSAPPAPTTAPCVAQPSVPVATVHVPPHAHESVPQAATVPTPAPTPASISTEEQLEIGASEATDTAPTTPPTPTPAQMAHLLAIRERLDPKERAIAEAAIHKMTPEQLAHWLDELSAQSVEDATTTIRDLIAQIRQTPRPPQQ